MGRILNTFEGIKGCIGILGGSFDPIHNGHITIAKEALRRKQLTSVIFIPANRNPLKHDSPEADAKHRLEMISIAISQEPDFFISRYEIDRPPPSYTIDTLRRAQSELYGSQLFYILGSDSLFQITKWKDFQDILKIVKLIPVGRKDFPKEKLDSLRTTVLKDLIDELRENFIQNGFVDISSSEIRDGILSNRDMSKVLPGGVLSYIISHNLYDIS